MSIFYGKLYKGLLHVMFLGIVGGDAVVRHMNVGLDACKLWLLLISCDRLGIQNSKLE